MNHCPPLLHLVHVIHSLNPANGGTTSAVLDLAEQCALAGVASEVICLDGPDAPWLGVGGVPTTGGGPGVSHYGWTPKFAPVLAGKLKADSWVVVHGLWQHHAVAARAVCARAGTPYMVCPHGMLDPWALRQSLPKRLMKKLNWMLLMQRVVREAALVCFTTEAEQGVAAAALVGVGTPQAVVPLGVGGPPKPAAELRRAWKQTHPDLADARVLLFLGRLHPKKGCDLLITGYARWRKEHGEAAAGYHLRMVGPAMSDGYLRELHDRCTAEELEAGKDVSFPGMLTGEAKWQELAAAEAFVLPSYQENFGLAVGEALALGTPVLLSDKVNLWPWIAEGEAGFVAPPSVDGVTDLLTQWAALDEAERDGMKRRALTLYQAKFSPVKAAARFVRMVADASRKPVPQR